MNEWGPGNKCHDIEMQAQECYRANGSSFVVFLYVGF